jgi:YegS/Rv2252/BmrU family lipid kinase
MNEVINGVFTQQKCSTKDITLGMITVGTGNDWGRMFGVPTDYEKAVQLVIDGKICLQDAGVVQYYHGTERDKRYFVNMAGLGFDALVVRRTNSAKDRGKSSKTIYYWTLVRSLFSYKHTATEVVVDGKKIENDTFSMSLGIGRYSGGGMRQTPNALPDDGLFDLTIIKKMRRGELIRSLKRLYDGTILDHPKIEGYTGKNIKIDSDPLIHVEADGESLGHSPIEFDIIPKSINVICGVCANEKE